MNATTSYRETLINSQIATVSKMIRLALQQRRQLGRNLWAKALELGVKATLNGAQFLLSSDLEAGRSAYACLAHLEMAELPEIAELCGILATLIAASVRRDREQASRSGLAIGRMFDEQMLEGAREAWRNEKPLVRRLAA